MNSNYWLKCSLNPGMYDEEYAAEFKIPDGRLISMFVYKDYVKKEKSLIKVQVLKRNLESILVFLPAYPLEITSRAVYVSPSQIVEEKP